MKDHFRQSMAWLHTWAGLVAAWVLFFIFVTGSAGYFNTEIDRWMRPELPLAQPTTLSPADAVALAQRYLQSVAGGAQEFSINLPVDRGNTRLNVWWRAQPAAGQRFGQLTRQTLDDAGAPVAAPKVRATGGGNQLYRMHYRLRYMSLDAARYAVGVCTMLMLLALVSGVIVHKKIFADFFTFRPGKGQRSWLDAHNVVSVLALPFFVMITYSGLVFFLFDYVPAGLQAGMEGRRDAFFEQISPRQGPAAPGGVAAPLAPLERMVRQAEAAWGAGEVGRITVAQPGDALAWVTVHRRPGRSVTGAGNDRLHFDGVSGRPLPAPAVRDSGSRSTRDVLLALHEGRFAGVGLRWLYFASSLLGCAMIATGLVLWTVKRRRDQEKRLKAGQSVAFGFRLVEVLNIGTIAGLCTAVAAFFWANRLLPAGLDRRADWEFHCLFIIWGLALLHAALRLRFAPSRRVWREQLWLACAAFGLLPLLNALTTDRHLGVTLPAGDWVLAGFDLTMLALGAVFALMASKLRRTQAAPRPASQGRDALPAEAAALPAGGTR